MYNICRINTEVQTVKKNVVDSISNVYKVAYNSTTTKLCDFFKGVWGLPPQASKQSSILHAVYHICKMWHIY